MAILQELFEYSDGRSHSSIKDHVKIDYFLGKQISAFVSLNNIFGQNYQRYLYYQTQGLNFLGGISYSF